jgi:hypothetical protein
MGWPGSQATAPPDGGPAGGTGGGRRGGIVLNSALPFLCF